MLTKMRRNFFGACTARASGGGGWRIAFDAPNEAQILVRGADKHASGVFSTPLRDISVEWQDDRVLLTVLSGESSLEITALEVVVHEPVRLLYSRLPLAAFDRQTRRFWRRVFFLTRLPGGRSLLGLAARVSRKKS